VKVILAVYVDRYNWLFISGLPGGPNDLMPFPRLHYFPYVDLGAPSVVFFLQCSGWNSWNAGVLPSILRVSLPFGEPASSLPSPNPDRTFAFDCTDVHDDALSLFFALEYSIVE